MAPIPLLAMLAFYLGLYYLDSLLGSFSLIGLLSSGVLVGSTGPIGFSLDRVSSHSIERGWEGSLSPQISLVLGRSPQIGLIGYRSPVIGLGGSFG